MILTWNVAENGEGPVYGWGCVRCCGVMTNQGSTSNHQRYKEEGMILVWNVETVALTVYPMSSNASLYTFKNCPPYDKKICL